MARGGAGGQEHGHDPVAEEFVHDAALVIHGGSDPLIPLAAGQATADAIPGAEMLVIKGMGHDLPPGSWPAIVEALARHTERNEPA